MGEIANFKGHVGETMKIQGHISLKLKKSFNKGKWVI
jgi:hypothetical protein